MRPLILSVVVFYLEVTVCESSNCGRYGMEPIPEISNGICFGLIPPWMGKMTYYTASQKCIKFFGRDAKVTTPYSRSELKVILHWALKKGLPTDSMAGFWTNYMRDVKAPLNEEFELETRHALIRRNRLLFHIANQSFTMPEELWRDETQPGNTDDERDEWCTAQKKPGEPAKFLGLDDFECDGIQRHYAVCDWFFACPSNERND
ncbi:uncharacterized protein LOC142335482 [Convolutriloba macropyga]|uniref:uncharacterized protein LOC142335482 n=1 Tax=Convolutriloba macropyga TaxID=536237 RepID=UPI003F520A68